MTASPWRIAAREALLETQSLTGALNLDRPDLGMTSIKVGDTILDGNFWGWVGEDRSQTKPAGTDSPPCLDAYSRGGDLIVTYGPTDDRPFETQLYWSVSTDANAGGELSLLVSIRTHLLDTEPVIRVTSRRKPPSEAGSATNQQDASIVWQRAGGNQLWIAEACDQADQTQLVGDPSRGEVAWELFAHFLEKGVIRRARLMFAADKDQQRVRDAHEQFLKAPLPLTT